MTSPATSSLAGRATAARLAIGLAIVPVVLPALPAFALPGLDLDADLYGGLRQGGSPALPGGNLDMDLYVGTPVLRASVHAFGLGSQAGVAEGVLRWELPVPFVAIRPGIGYQANTLFGTLAGSSAAGAVDSAPYGNVQVAIEPPLLPVTFDAAVGASYPLGLQAAVVDYLADVNWFPLPLVPVGLSARYRGYTVTTMGLPAVSAVELGLRIKL